VAAAVSLPAMGLVLATDPGAARCPWSSASAPRLITSRHRAPHAAVIVAHALGCDAVRLGSAGAKAMAVVLGEADIYLHDGGMYQWDSAAPAAVAQAAGLHVSRIDGSPLVYNGATRGCPTSSCAVPSTPSRCSTRCGDERRGPVSDSGSGPRR
jgi:3'(2'), 5'-bisphosphate nucleotidase